MGNIKPVDYTTRLVEPLKADTLDQTYQPEEVILTEPANIKQGAVTIPETIAVATDKSEPEVSRFEMITNAATKRYNQANIAIKPHLADARIIIGALAVLAGMAGLITLFSGIKLPLTHFLKKYSTLSVTVSLITIQTGLSSIHQGVSYKDTELLLQQETQRTRALYEIEQRERDINSVNTAPIHTRAEVESLESTLPKLAAPGMDEGTITINTSEKQAIVESKWSSWWRKRLPLLGKMQLVNGTLMLGVGLVALAFMFKSHFPPGLSVIGQDPSLSVAFSLVLMTYWISSLREGWQMIGYEECNKKRAKEVDQLKLVDEGLNILEQLELKEKDQEKLQEHLISFKERAKQTLRMRHDEIEKVTTLSRLATPSILLGVATTLLAGVFLTMTYTGHVPKSLDILTKNTPLSTLFAGTLLISGIGSIQAGAAMSKHAQQLAESNLTAEYREALLEHFAQYEPILPEAKKFKKATPRSLATVQLHESPEHIEDKTRLQTGMDRILETRPNAFQRLWLESLRGLWVPQALWGTLLLATGVGGIAFAFGAPIPHAFSALAGHQGYTIAQSISLLGAAFLALRTSYSMGMYQSYRDEENAEQKLIRKTYERLVGTKRVAQINLRA